MPSELELDRAKRVKAEGWPYGDLLGRSIKRGRTKYELVGHLVRDGIEG